jgi:hypothetical protein
MLRQPERLRISHKRNLVLWRCALFVFPFLGNLLAFVRAPNWFAAVSLFIFGSLWLILLYLNFVRWYVVVDELGISYLARRLGAVLPWSQIEACARKSENGRRNLRIFLRQGAETMPTAVQTPNGAADIFTRYIEHLLVKPGAENYFDIDFNLAEKPEQSLEEAFQACLAWIAATRKRA